MSGDTDKLAQIEALVEECVRKGVTGTTDFRTADVVALIEIAKAAREVNAWVRGLGIDMGIDNADAWIKSARELDDALSALDGDT